MSLAMALRLNALSCFGFGLLFLAVPAAVAAALGSPPVWLIAALGAGLLGNAVLLWLAQRRGRAPRRNEVLFFCLGDALWVVATLALVITGTWITTATGQAVTLAVAVLVALFGLAQMRALVGRAGT